MIAKRLRSELPDPLRHGPACPSCRDTSFVRNEQVITGGRIVAFWTCSSCLRSWPAVAPRMAKADLRRRKGT
jgi:hypothetical protein